MPNQETMLTFTFVSFLLVHYLITTGFPRLYATVLLIATPVVMAACLVISRNATLAQVSVGALVGTWGGIWKAVVFHTMLEEPFYAFINLPIISFLFPNQARTDPFWQQQEL
jgi:hypothetical protein